MKPRNPGPHVGTRIRTLRERRKLSLRALSEASGLSVNAIGMIERGENSPTVSSLHNLADALNVRIIDFFEEAREQAVVIVREEQRLKTSGECGVMESLGQGLRNQQMEPFMVTLKGGCHGDGVGSSGDRPGPEGSGEPVQHSGEEFVLCLSGEIEYEISGNRHILKAGDSLIFDSAQPHAFRNLLQEPSRFVVVFQAEEGPQVAVQRHLGA
jgi:transcriptional regulator with XRE-family HTH domain